jgi:hypothetical protein
MSLNKSFRSKFRIRENVEIVLRDKDGNIKPIFQPNKFFLALIRKGILSPKAVKIPFLFGNWADKMVVSNLITNTGFAGIASRINGDGAEAAFTYIAVGTGATAADVGDTTLEAEIADSGLARAAGTPSRSTTDVTNDTAELTKTFTVTGTKAVTESGALNAAAAGILLNRQVFSAVNVVNGDSLQITHKFDVD